MDTIRVGAAQGFYGDALFAAVETAQRGNVRYLSFDALAELTMAILAKDRARDPQLGYAKDITPAMQALLPLAKENDFKILTNAGGIHPEAAGQEVLRVARVLGLTGLKVAVVTGDDVMAQLEELQREGVALDDLDTGRALSEVGEKLMFANAYLGAGPIVEALRMGADVVVTGRTTDTAQFLAPLIYEFGWREDDWDALAQGILMGHLMECSAQSTGGNFSGRWWDVDGMDHMGYPVAEVRRDGDFILTKTEGTGGLVTVDTVKEQMLYEIHDPSAYLTPDVVADFTTAELKQAGVNRVSVKGAAGRPRPDTLKVVMGYEDGYMGQAMIGYSWPNALRKARAAEDIVRKQLARRGWTYEEIHASYLGFNSLHGNTAPEPEQELNEVYLRMAVRAKSRQDAMKFGRLFPPLALNGPPHLGGAGGMEAPRQLIGMWSTLVPRGWIEKRIHVSMLEVTE
ncbi:MAG: acyclic terpene utilization AtuA family protein [Bacilli bacterium]